MIYKSWMVLNILDKFYYHASKQHSYYFHVQCAMSNQLTYLLIPISISIGYTGMR